LHLLTGVKLADDAALLSSLPDIIPCKKSPAGLGEATENHYLR